MTLEKARKIVEQLEEWNRGKPVDGLVCLDGRFKADELEAIALLMRAGEYGAGPIFLDSSSDIGQAEK